MTVLLFAAALLLLGGLATVLHDSSRRLRAGLDRLLPPVAEPPSNVRTLRPEDGDWYDDVQIHR